MTNLHYYLLFDLAVLLSIGALYGTARLLLWFMQTNKRKALIKRKLEGGVTLTLPVRLSTN
jgi:hypothetical protein